MFGEGEFGNVRLLEDGAVYCGDTASDVQCGGIGPDLVHIDPGDHVADDYLCGIEPYISGNLGGIDRHFGNVCLVERERGDDVQRRTEGYPIGGGNTCGELGTLEGIAAYLVEGRGEIECDYGLVRIGVRPESVGSDRAQLRIFCKVEGGSVELRETAVGYFRHIRADMDAHAGRIGRGVVIRIIDDVLVGAE